MPYHFNSCRKSKQSVRVCTQEEKCVSVTGKEWDILIVDLIIQRRAERGFQAILNIPHLLVPARTASYRQAKRREQSVVVQKLWKN